MFVSAQGRVGWKKKRKIPKTGRRIPASKGFTGLIVRTMENKELEKMANLGGAPQKKEG